MLIRRQLMMALGFIWAWTCALAPAGVRAADELSPAEIGLFTTDHLGRLTPPAKLNYAYRHGGTLDAAYDDSVEVTLAKGTGGERSVSTRCLSGERELRLPDMDFAQGNPALLCFLERDIRHMEKLTGGKSNYFRQRIRLALADRAQSRDIQVEWGGRQVAAREFRIAPYEDDPRRGRFERYAQKHYVFRVSDAVPGGLIAVEAVVTDGAAKDVPPLLADSMTLLPPTNKEKK